MKKTINLLSIMLVLILSSFTINTTNEVPVVPNKSLLVSSNYCDGYKQGYKDGWCYRDRFGCIPPIPPICPIPRVGEHSSDYKAGYQRGFVAGKAARDDRN